MNSQPKISIIVAVYKAEAYLQKSIASVLSQSFRDFELLLIDDGSPDNSGKICDTFAKQDSRVRVFHKQNGGVSSAREMGVNQACGEYIIQLDPDDWVDSDMLEEMYKYATKIKVDMVVCDYWVEYTDGRSIYKNQKPTALNADAMLYDLFEGRLSGSTWNKLIKRECYLFSDAKFPVGVNYCEDLYVISMMLKHNIKVGYLPKAFYHYIRGINSESLVYYYNDEVMLADLKLYELISVGLGNHNVGALAKGDIACMIAQRAIRLDGINRTKYKKILETKMPFIVKYPHLSLLKKYLIYLSYFISPSLGFRVNNTLISLKYQI